MRYIILSAVAALVLAGFLWRNSGEKLTLTPPTSVTILVGKVKTSNEVSFHRHWPIFGWYSPREIEPSLQAGAVIQVDLSSSEITEWGWSNRDMAFRVSQKVREKTTHTYFLNTDKMVKGARHVTLRIKNHGFKPSDAIHQQEWFWVREFYDCEVIAVS